MSLAYLTLYSVRPKLARAARARRTAREAGGEGSPTTALARSSVPSATRSRRASYAMWLGATYALAPVLALATWRALERAFPGAAVSSVAAGLLVLLPALMQLAHGSARRAGVALASLLGCLAFGGAAGGALGRALAHARCAPETHGECGLTVLAWLLLGSAVGGVLGYCVHAVRQVLGAARMSRLV